MNSSRIFAIIILFSLVFFAVSPSLLATSPMEQPIFSEGDFWTYEFGLLNQNGNKTIVGQERIEVGGTESIALANGQQVSARILTATRQGTKNMGQDDESIQTITTVYYYDESSLGIIQQVSEGSEFTGKLIGVFDPPYWTFEWPLSVGNEWRVNSNNTWSIYTGEHYSQPVNSSGICRNETEISTPAGRFSCFEVQWWPIRQNRDAYDLIYISPEVGFQPVRKETHNEESTPSSINYMELKDFHYGDYGTTTANGSPGFEAILVVGLLIVFALWRRMK